MKRIKSLHHNLVLKYHINPVLSELKKLAFGRLIDIGCGDKPFYPILKDQVDEYIGVDHPETLHTKDNIDVFADVYALPFEDNSFDTAILTQVIEHLEKPEKAIKEINRILKPGGKLFVSWPFLYPIHEAPRDFYRYTKFGMRYLAEEAGFKNIEIKSSSGFWITFFGLLSKYFYGKPTFIYILLYPIIFILKYLCIVLNYMDNNEKSKDRWTWNYYGIFIK